MLFLLLMGLLVNLISFLFQAHDQISLEKYIVEPTTGRLMEQKPDVLTEFWALVKTTFNQ